MRAALWSILVFTLAFAMWYSLPWPGASASQAAQSTTPTPQTPDLPGQPPAIDLPPQEVDLWEHRSGPEAAVHITAAGVEADRKARRFDEYIEFEIVVSDNGRVDFARALGKSNDHTADAQQIELARVYKPWTRDGVPIRVRLHDYVQLLPPERWADTPAPFPHTWEPGSVSIGLTRTGCFGTCPNYHVTIAGDGTVHFTGRQFVLIPGDHTAHIPPDEVRLLIDQFASADFFSARHEYSSSAIDSPTQMITLTIAGHTKTVGDNLGLQDGLPLAISNLEVEIDRVAGTARWVKGNDQTLKSLGDEHWPFAEPNKQNVALYVRAITTKNRPLLDKYLAARGPIVSPDIKQFSPICAASLLGDLSLVKRMRASATSAHLRAPRTKAPISPPIVQQCLWSAARSGTLALLQYWLQEGGNPTAPPLTVESDSWYGASLLAKDPSRDAALIRKLLERKIDINAPKPEMPLLPFALQLPGKDTPQIVELLVKEGADVNFRNSSGETAIFLAGSVPDAVKSLLAGGADIEARNQNGDTALIRNAFMEPFVREMLGDGADPSAVAKNGDTPLKVAKSYSCAPCASLIKAALKSRGQGSWFSIAAH